MSKATLILLALSATASLSSQSRAAEQWISQIGGKGAEVVFDVVETSEGRLCATGTFWSSARFGSGEQSVELNTPAAQDMFVACYDADGILKFARRFGAQRGDEPRAVAALPGGDIVVAGLFSHEIGLTSHERLKPPGKADMFLLRLDAKGETVWSRQFGGRLADSANALAVTPDGDIVLAGNFSGLMTYRANAGHLKLNSAGARDAVVMKLSPGGEVLWARRAGGNAFDEVTAVAVAADGGVVVAGSFRNTAMVGESSLTSRGFKDVFVLALDAQGNSQWTQHLGGAGQDEVRGLAADPLGRIHVAGNFQKTLVLPGGETLATAGGTDVFVVRLGSDGGLQRASAFGGQLTDQVFSIAGMRDGRLVLSGHFQGNTDVAPGSDVVTLKSPTPGNSGGFVVVLDAAGNHAWSKSINGSGMEMVLAVAATTDGGVALAGLYNEDLVAPAGSLDNRGKTDVFITRINPVVGQRMAGTKDSFRFDW